MLEFPYAKAKRATAPAMAYATGLFVGAALVEICSGAEVDAMGVGVEDGGGGGGGELVADTMTVEAGSVVVGGGGRTVDETG